MGVLSWTVNKTQSLAVRLGIFSIFMTIMGLFIFAPRLILGVVVIIVCIGFIFAIILYEWTKTLENTYDTFKVQY